MDNTTNNQNPWKTIQPITESFPGNLINFDSGPRAAHSCELIGNHLFVFGGWNGKKALNDMYMMNIHNFQW